MQENLSIIAVPRNEPSIECDAANGTIAIIGCSTPRIGVVQCYQPLMEWVEKYMQNPQQHTHVTVRLQYNTSSTLIYLRGILFDKLQELHDNGYQVTLCWYYDEDYAVEYVECFYQKYKYRFDLIEDNDYWECDEEESFNEAVERYKKVKDIDDDDYDENDDENNKSGDEAFRVFENLARQGHARAMYYLAKCYSKSIGVAGIDMKKYNEWMLKSANRGFVEAQWAAAITCKVNEDFAKAAEWFRKAAEQGKCEAQFEIGEYYEKGLGVTQDFARAVEWYRKAAAQRHGMAIKYLERLAASTAS